MTPSKKKKSKRRPSSSRGGAAHKGQAEPRRPAPRLESTFLQTNNLRLHVMQAGPKTGIPVVLLHGFPEFWYGWRKQIPALAEAGCRVYAPDQRGYNLSDKPAGVRAYRIHELVNDVIGLIDALEYEKVNLVGHDWGALAAWALGIWKPERLHRLAVMNAPHPAVMARFLARDLEQIRRSWYVFSIQMPWLPEAGLRARDWRNMERWLRGSGKPHTFKREDVREYKKAWSQPGALTAMLNWYRAALQFRPSIPKQARVSVPTLMLWGMQDAALTHRMARPSMDFCDDGRLIFFEDASHWVQLDAAEEVNRLLIEFFKS
jgi:pimeloyl-ACP methyl ester carboxylesterase